MQNSKKERRRTMEQSFYRRNLYDASEDICNRFGENILFRNGNRDITFSQTLSAIKRRGGFIAEMGYGKNDVVAILSENSPEWCITLLAACSSGCIALPLDINLKEDNYREMLSAVNAKAVFASEKFMNITDSIPVHPIGEEWSMADESSFRPYDAFPDETAAMLFTSGTTGTPKIVQLSHTNLLHIACVCTELEEYTEKDVTLAMLPFFHIYALEATFLAPFVTGSMLVLQNSLKGPDIMKSLADNPVTIFPAAPLMWELFFNALAAKAKAQSELKYRLFMFFVNNAPMLRGMGLGFLVNKIFAPVHDAFGRTHRFFISGGAPMKKEYFNYYKHMGFNIMEGYGLSETTGPIAIPYYKKSYAGSVGAPIKGNEVRIKNMNQDGIGEIWLRGPAVMPGYYANDVANREVFDSDGFFNTGDLGRVDKNGAIHVTGRLKNVIVLDSGKKVYPEEIEFYFRQSPLIGEIAVFDHPVEGTASVFAVVVPAAGSKVSFSEIRKAVAELNSGLPQHKRVSRFALSIDELPKNSTRKILYREIKKMLEQGMYQESENDSAALSLVLAADSPAAENVIRLLKRKLNEDVLYHNQTLQDLNIDSLRLIDLIVYLEQGLGVQIDAELMREKRNLGELVSYLSTLEKSDSSSLDDRILNGEITTRMNRFFNPMHHVTLALFRIGSRLLWGVRVTGIEKLEINNTIIIANHQSYLDMVWLAISIPRSKRGEVYVTGKKRLSFLRFIFPVLPIIFVDEDNGVEVLKAGADVLRSGKTLVIFPEGTRSSDGKLQQFRSGASYLASKLDRTVIPVSVHGAYNIWPRTRKFPKVITPLRGGICVGDPIWPSDYDSVESLNRAMMDAVSTGINRLSGNPAEKSTLP